MTTVINQFFFSGAIGQGAGLDNHPAIGQGAGVSNRPGIGQGAGVGNRPGIGQGAGVSNRPGIGEGAGVSNRPGIGEGADVNNRPGIGEGASVSNGSSIGQGAGVGNGQYLQYEQHPIGDTISVMMILMNPIQSQTGDKLRVMQDKSNISRDAQDMANKVDVVLSGLKDGKAGADLPADVVKYMKEHNILVDSQSIDDFLANKENYAEDGKLKSAALQTVKNALESVSGRASDFLQTAQLKMQQLMQNYNIAVQMIQSLSSMLGESNKGIASAIR